jgi:hypothetical protein
MPDITVEVWDDSFLDPMMVYLHGIKYENDPAHQNSCLYTCKVFLRTYRKVVCQTMKS